MTNRFNFYFHGKQIKTKTKFRHGLIFFLFSIFENRKL